MIYILSFLTKDLSVFSNLHYDHIHDIMTALFASDDIYTNTPYEYSNFKNMRYNYDRNCVSFMFVTSDFIEKERILENHNSYVKNVVRKVVDEMKLGNYNFQFNLWDGDAIFLITIRFNRILDLNNYNNFIIKLDQEFDRKDHVLAFCYRKWDMFTYQNTAYYYPRTLTLDEALKCDDSNIRKRAYQMISSI